MKPRPVLVEWDDSTHISPGGWVDRENACGIGACSIMTVGWLIDKDKHTITIAQSITEADDATGVFVIPRAVIRQLRRLKGE